MICTAPRSGSTLLCELLGATGQAGRPNSHFHRPSLSDWLETYELGGGFATDQAAFRAVLAAALAKGRGGTEVFGLRMQRGSFTYFMDQLCALFPEQASDTGRIEAAFGPTLFIHLTRPDRLGQAISRLRAEQTGLWHRRADGSELERLAPPKPAVYDAAALAGYIAEATGLDADWAAWFEAEGLHPHRIHYDDLAEDPQGVLAGCLAALGRDPALARAVDTPTAKLADAINENWRARFEAEQAR